VYKMHRSAHKCEVCISMPSRKKCSEVHRVHRVVRGYRDTGCTKCTDLQRLNPGPVVSFSARDTVHPALKTHSTTTVQPQGLITECYIQDVLSLADCGANWGRGPLPHPLHRVHWAQQGLHGPRSQVTSPPRQAPRLPLWPGRRRRRSGPHRGRARAARSVDHVTKRTRPDFDLAVQNGFGDLALEPQVERGRARYGVGRDPVREQSQPRSCLAILEEVEAESDGQAALLVFRSSGQGEREVVGVGMQSPQA
jgi:hypothetical protein